LRLFLDNCLSPHQAKALDALSETDGHKVVHLKEKFARNTPDEVWIPQLASQGEWVIVSGDMRIFKSRLLRQVWRDAKLTTFFLGKGWMNQAFWDQAWWLVRWWPRILQQAEVAGQGTGFEVPAKPQGKLTPLT
jgi:PIN domain-containing protein